MSIRVQFGRRTLPIGMPTIERAEAAVQRAEAAAETAAADAIAAAQPAIVQATQDAVAGAEAQIAADRHAAQEAATAATGAAQTAAADAAALAAPAAAAAIRDQVKTDADRAETVAASMSSLDRRIPLTADALVDSSETLFALASNGSATDLTVMLDGQVAEFALRRWWSRFQGLGLTPAGTPVDPAAVTALDRRAPVDAEAKVSNADALFAVVANGQATDLTLNPDGQLAEFALRRWAARMEALGLISGGANSSILMPRADPYPPRLMWSISNAAARSAAGTAPQAGVVNTTINGEPVRLTLPPNYDDRRPVVVVMAFEGTNYATGGSPNLNPREDLANLPPLANVAWLAGRMHGNSWGNADCMADARAMYDWVTSVIGVSGFIVFGNSMGGVAALNAVHRSTFPGIYGIYLTDPAYDLRNRYVNSSTGNLEAAYGIDASGSNYSTVTNGFDPALTEKIRYRGLPMRVRGSSTDGTVPFSLHGQKLAADLAFHNDVDLIDLNSGGHNNSNRFNAADFAAFIEKCCGGKLA